MIQLRDIHPLTDFKRQTKKHLDRLRKSGRPEILTINGKAELVVFNADAYEKYQDRLEQFESVKAIEQSLKRMRAGKSGIPAEKVFAKLRKKLNIEL